MSIRGQDGAGSVLALSMVGLLVSVTGAAVGVDVVVVRHRQVQAAADLAALAGAAAAQSFSDPCVAAARSADANDAALASCLTDGQVVEVVTTITLPALFGGRRVRARARAGPQDAVRGATGPGEAAG